MTNATFTLVSPLVGAYHRPPAKLVLAALPAGSVLVLEPEPENLYDSRAIAVWVVPGAIPEGQHEMLREELPNSGWVLETLLATPRLQLGYVASATNRKALGEDPIYVGNDRVAEALLAPDHRAILGFAPTGQPLVLVAYSAGAPGPLAGVAEEESNWGDLDP